jgi:hypothetical protein
MAVSTAEELHALLALAAMLHECPWVEELRTIVSARVGREMSFAEFRELVGAVNA